MTEKKLKKKMLETFESLKKIQLQKKNGARNLYFNDLKQIGLCLKTSTPHSSTQKYWYTLALKEQSFLNHYKKSYVFLGCLDNNKTVYLISFDKYKKDFLNCDVTQTGWHIRINRRLYWYFSKEPDIHLSNFECSLFNYTD